jgi:hypothetical protein
MGSLRKRGSIWWIRYYNKEGRRIEESSGYKSWDDARDLLKRREGAIADGANLTPKSIKLTFDMAVQAVEDDYTINAKKSLEWVQRRIKLHLKPVFGGRRLSAIKAADLRAFKAARMHAGASAAEINRELAIVRRASAGGQGGVVSRPYSRVRDVGRTQRPGRLLQSGQLPGGLQQAAGGAAARDALRLRHRLENPQ